MLWRKIKQGRRGMVREVLLFYIVEEVLPGKGDI